MDNIKGHQHTKEQLNWSTSDAVIGAGAHLCPPLMQTLFSLNLCTLCLNI